ncbi:GMP synthase [Colletotrichum higginsianum IMI 349063]|uniref:GMP synthase n=1 Tax=Colletotrichum higginsianum (strain IMI 349063) TaxID=759273 RepID=A0A1B7YUN4_COLHI|nr:GMP synthase [Colletotrichum higginsianum IMI 349063]OBR15747.1 GMP synthase [Colletotrichum higginsianum IMI 349063]
MKETIGNCFHAILVDNGVTRLNESNKTFIDLFEKLAENMPSAGKVGWFSQGTLYPNGIESLSFKNPSATIGNCSGRRRPARDPSTATHQAVERTVQERHPKRLDKLLPRLTTWPLRGAPDFVAL